MILKNKLPCVQKIESVRIYPGINVLEDADSAKLLANAAFAETVKMSNFEIIGSDSVKTADKAPKTISELKEDEAKKVVAEIYMLPMLEELEVSEKRPAVLQAIRKQIKKISIKPEDK